MRFLGANFEMDLMRGQALRSSPPGAAGTRNDRRRVFGAALHQFDGLVRIVDVRTVPAVRGSFPPGQDGLEAA